MIATMSALPPLFSAPHRMAARRDLRGPGLLDLADQRRRPRYVIKFGRHISAILVGPGKELQCFADRSRIARLLVYQNKACAGDGPALGAGLIGQNQIVVVRMSP